ncbi:fimbria/pilus periplasmic chaperone [Enterobacter hormaechei]
MALLPLTLTSASAGVIIGGPVLFLMGLKRSVNKYYDPDNGPYLIQSWIDVQDEQSGKAPLLLPSAVSAGRRTKNLERIVMTGSLPQGQESLFWLNIKAIPSASKQMNAGKLPSKRASN